MFEQMLPRKIWFCWLQGWAHAPELVRICHQSWVHHNPDWEIVVLDETSAETYLEGDRSWADDRLPIQKRANLLRLALLDQHGGVWVDATCFCTGPLDHWIDDCMASGFFAFREDGGERILANWFLAAMPGNELVREFRKVHADYWLENRFRNPRRLGVRVLTGVLERLFSLNSRWRDAWFSWTVCKIFRVHPYFAFHYHVAWLLRRSVSCRHIFNGMAFRDATPILEPGRLIRESKPFKEICRSVQSDLQPLYKFNWKHPYFQDDVSNHIQMMFNGMEESATGVPS